MELYTSDRTRHPRGGYDQARVAAIRGDMRAAERAYRLAELRERSFLNQTELGERIGIGQRTVSKIEHGDVEHSKLETLRKYIEGIGGRLEVVARFGDETYTIA
ncbi:helix-turn-helix domain-containing protein [Nocardia thailandica]|uniref:helix-turn-helix domain-containing protein n=1 Tax=Nocardia thailandica TaxID=257275 RepID=UPI000694D5C2|nr:helix-turn-helix transcriptional regulator [Nocardia thailandica]